MYINPKMPGEAKTTPVKRTYVNNQMVGAFIVRAKQGFSLSGTHKFNIYNRDGFMVPEYCKPCSSARRFIGVDGEEVDYVQSALSKFEPVSTDDFKRAEFEKSFRTLLIDEYQRLT